MDYRRYTSIAIQAVVLLGLSSGLYVGLAQAQQTAEASGGATTTIRAESRLVLVDVVVTDKNGNYVEDLSKADFRVYQDHRKSDLPGGFRLERLMARSEGPR